jgi:hypothetical protein
VSFLLLSFILYELLACYDLLGDDIIFRNDLLGVDLRGHLDFVLVLSI